MKIIGHRGARGLAPENTIASFEKAIAHHVDELECDVRVTQDGQVIVIHNPDLVDQANNRLTVTKYDYAELLTHKPDLATLSQVITAVNKRVPLQIEIKPGVATEPIVTVVSEFLAKGWKPTDFLFGSKDFSRLVLVHAALPNIQTVVIEPWSGIRATMHARQLGTKRLSMNKFGLWIGFIGPMAKRGYLLSAYSLNNVKLANTWKRYGLYGVITDYPDRFQKPAK